MAKKTRKAGGIEKFKVTFFSECSERLSDIESILNSLRNNGVQDDEQFHELFRAVHSIKGGAGAFGFDRITDLSHSYETVLDALRSHSLEVTQDVTDLLIQASDILAEIIDIYQAGKKPAAKLDKKIKQQLDSLLNPENTEDETNSQPVEDAALETSDETNESGEPIMRTVYIHFLPDETIFETANDPLFVIRELKTFGTLKVNLNPENLPPLEQLDAELSYLAWDFELQTKRSDADIRETFEFVNDVCKLEISKKPFPSDESDPKPSHAVPSKQPQPGKAPTQLENKSITKEIQQGALIKPNALIRVELDRVDKLVNMVGELAITQAVLEQNLNEIEFSDESTLRNLSVLSSHMREIQENVMEIRMQPVQSVFARMPRLVRELARSLGKKVRLVTAGETTEVDKTIIEHLTDPLTHMIRNSIDHGIETPEERVALGKPEEATIFLSASHRSGQIAIEVIDDGHGINLEKVFQRAIEKEIIPANAELSDDAICDLIFTPGFSTVSEITDVSGRGVGMDVVRRISQEIGGRVIVDSTPGRGCRFLLALPLTLAVMDGMIVEVGDEQFVMPIGCIIESVRPTEQDISEIAGQGKLAHFREDYVPLIFLHRIFGIPESIEDPCQGLVMFVETDVGNVIGIVVDELLEERQVVIKSIEENFMPVEGISAATILGNGQVALILEVNGLHDMYRNYNKPALQYRPQTNTELNGVMAR